MLASVPVQSSVLSQGISSPLSVPSLAAPVVSWSLPSPLPTPWPAGPAPVVAPGPSASSAQLAPFLDPSGAVDCGSLPERLVEKARSGQFVELREFLGDNIKLLDRLESAQAAGMPPVVVNPLQRPRLREISSPISWIYCFAAYVAVRTSDPLTRDMLTYARIVLGEALRHGGSGWIEYDRAARQWRARCPSRPWNMVDTGLHSTLILGHGSRTPAQLCSHCQGSDHTSAQCALAVFELPRSGQLTGPDSAPVAPSSRKRDRNDLKSLICWSWNRGACLFPGTCIYRHVCGSCEGRHRSRDCPSALGSGSEPRAPGRGRKRPPLAPAATGSS